jgi:hypothetical protein
MSAENFSVFVKGGAEAVSDIVGGLVCVLGCVWGAL